jgi:hypothetical protein
MVTSRGDRNMTIQDFKEAAAGGVLFLVTAFFLAFVF